MSARSLGDLAAELSALAGRVGRDRKASAEIARAEDSRRRLDEALTRLRQSSQIFRVGVEMGFLDGEMSEAVQSSVEDVTGSVRDLKGTAQEDPIQAVLRPEAGYIAGELARLADRMRTDARNAWEHYWTRLIPDSPRTLLEAIQPGLPPSQQRLVNKILTRDQYLAVKIGSPPESQGEYDELMRSLTERDEWFAQIDVSDDDDVIDFLVQSSRDGFPLSGVTPQLVTWLNSHDIIEHYSVVPRGSA